MYVIISFERLTSLHLLQLSKGSNVKATVVDHLLNIYLCQITLTPIRYEECSKTLKNQLHPMLVDLSPVYLQACGLRMSGDI